MLRRKVANEIKSLIMDAVGEVTENNFKAVFKAIVGNHTRDFDFIVAQIEEVFVGYLDQSENLPDICYKLDRVQINMYIRSFLYEKYEETLQNPAYNPLQIGMSNMEKIHHLINEMSEVVGNMIQK